MATGILTGTYHRPDGTPWRGTVHIYPSVPVVRDETGDVIVAGSAAATLDGTGSFSVPLAASDDLTLDPSGVTYRVSLRGLPPVEGVFIPAGGTVDMADVTTVDPAAPVYAVQVSQADLTSAVAGLSTVYAQRGAPLAPAPLLLATPITPTKTGTKAVTAYNAATGKFYGTDTSNGHFITSTDLVTWTDRTYSPSALIASGSVVDFDTTYMYALSLAAGRLFRALLDDFANWTEISVTARGPLTTGRPGSLCALGSGVLLFGNYTSGAGDGAHIWRSTDAGANWTEVLTLASAKHMHSIRANPAVAGEVWASVGDAGYPGEGLYRSTNNGASWTLMSSNDYGIDMVFVPSIEGRPALVVLEGDGLNRPHLMAFAQDGEAGDKTFPLVWFDGVPGASDCTRGTARGIGLTANNDIVYWTTTEAGAVGARAGLWAAQAPDYTRSVLLVETTGAEPVSYSRTYFSGVVAQNYLWTFTTPTFGSY